MTTEHNNKKIRLLIILGEGGHTTELLNLVDDFDDYYEYHYVLSREDKLSAPRIIHSGVTHCITRPRGKKTGLLRSILRTFITSFESLQILFHVRPQAILSTGPALAVPISILGKLLGVTVVFVETGSRVKRLSLTGRIMYRWADLFFVQWPQLTVKLPKAIFAGHLLSSNPEVISRQGSKVFVTVGSTDFDELIQAADSLAPTLNQSGVMQIGHGRYQPLNWPYFRFAASLDSYFEEAAVVIAHGGLATTMEALMRGLPLVSISNPDRYDNHQDDLLAFLADEGYLIWCRELEKLNNAIKMARNSQLRRYSSSECHIHLMINEFLGTQKQPVHNKIK